MWLMCCICQWNLRYSERMSQCQQRSSADDDDGKLLRNENPHSTTSPPGASQDDASAFLSCFLQGRVLLNQRCAGQEDGLTRWPLDEQRIVWKKECDHFTREEERADSAAEFNAFAGSRAWKRPMMHITQRASGSLLLLPGTASY